MSESSRTEVLPALKPGRLTGSVNRFADTLSINADRVDVTAGNSPKPGEAMPNGTVYAGLSPETNRPLYTTPADAPLTYKFREAQRYAEGLDAHGHNDWRVPTKDELNLLFDNRAAIGGFNQSGADIAGCYQSSSADFFYAWRQCFSDGRESYDRKYFASALRCVR